MTPAGSKRTRDQGAPDPGPLLPLTPAAMHIVLALTKAELHGYAIMGEVKKLSNGALTIGPGTLYRSLQRMVRDGLIAETAGPVDLAWSDERRRYYRLTALGRQVGAAEARRFEALVDIARRRGLLPDPEKPRTP